ncbi:MAG: gliding motility-associated C-terminal domain-containing protein [Chitinophagales bacterium]|nr:gliding motility-associated C-terminal domain-containing protein [Chitinophagales bacterium]MDW8427078.1 gliding motility-associated C-terminal domain-containing protein [Chitinophagales bacterium]
MKRFLVFLFLTALSERSWGQCPAGLAPVGPNLVVNGDFENGNTGFSSAYTYCNASQCLTATGAYTVGSDPAFYNNVWVGADHTTGSGKFFMANGSTSAGQAVWCQTVPVDPNSYYQISYYLCSLQPQAPASLQLQVNGVNYFSAFAAPATTHTWKQFSQVMQTGMQTSFTICLINTKTQVDGNDFGLDDISVRKCECDLSISAGPDRSICYGDTVTLDGSGSIAYFWSPNYNIDCTTCEDPKVWPLTTTTYYATVSGPGGCEAIDSVVVTVFPPIDLQARPDTTICPGDVQLWAQGAISYQWEPAALLNDATIANPIATVTETTTFYVYGTDIHGCVHVDSVRIEVEGQLQGIVAGPDTSVCVGRELTLFAQGADYYEWRPAEGLSCSDCATPLVQNPLTDVTYVAYGYNDLGCLVGLDSVTIDVNQNCFYVLLPTAFSPNQDNRNDFFRPQHKGVIEYQLLVFNRWGQMVFRSTNPDAGWDGKFEGTEQPVGVYVWMLNATLEDRTQVQQQGTVTLVR